MKHLTLITLLTLLTACATPTSVEDAAPEPALDLEPGIYEAHSGEELSEDELYDELAAHRFVVVGERHGDAWHHEVEARVWRGVTERERSAALGMEMFQRPYQAALDAYVEGEIDEGQMLEETEYDERWGLDPDYYRPLWEHARQEGLPLVALNARRELTSEISEVGLEGLSDEDRAELPELDLSDEEHRAYVRRAFEAHDQMQMSDEQFERFYAAQVVWDETMADTAVRFLQDYPEFDTMVIVTGVAHANRQFGVPPRIERRLESSVAVVRPVNLARAGEGESRSLDELAEQADFVWVGEREVRSE